MRLANRVKHFLSILMSSAPKLVSHHFVRVTRLESLYLKVYSDKAVEHVYNLHVQHWKLECRNNDLEFTYISPSRLQVMIKEQVSKFPACSNFDYRQLLNCDGSVNEAKLDNYYSGDLVKFVDSYRL